MSVMKRYFKEIADVIQSTRKGMALTWKHAWDARKQRTQHNVQDPDYFSQSTGITTLQYPHIDIPTPDNGRYQLHNEMDDCIVCDKCVKVCPVDCIEIEPIKATGLVGHASDGSPIRLYAAKFDIDMSKC
jgi:NADH-quinone oxidoreductase subunit I